MPKTRVITPVSFVILLMPVLLRVWMMDVTAVFCPVKIPNALQMIMALWYRRMHLPTAIQQKIMGAKTKDSPVQKTILTAYLTVQVYL